MSTFVQLCQRVRQEAGIAGTGPSAVTNQTGEYKRLVDWVASAWEDLQNKRSDWLWMRGTFSFATIADQDSYTAAQAGISSRFKRWDRDSLRIYTTATGVADETELNYLPWEQWRRVYRIGTQTASRPTVATTTPDMQLGLGSKPTTGFTVGGDYWKSAQSLTADADTPECPSEYHMAIVYRALMMYARYMAAGEIYDDAKMNYDRMVRAMVSHQTPEMQLNGPMA
jgi:hypothetical protein